MDANEVKTEQLGMPIGTASNRLKKNIMFAMANTLGMLTCMRCQKRIRTVEEFSLDHIADWLHSDDPKKLFFDINNVSFSHLSCNTAHSRKIPEKHSTLTRYRKGCRCSGCRSANTKRMARYRAARKKRPATISL